jgi:uncharacterized protein with von Willebrand factor type A (vWA) domain
MASPRKSGFGIGFSKEVESILGAAQLGHLYPDEVRENLRIAGMVLHRKVEELDTYDEPVYDDEDPIEYEPEVTDE